MMLTLTLTRMLMLTLSVPCPTILLPARHTIPLGPLLVGLLGVISDYCAAAVSLSEVSSLLPNSERTLMVGTATTLTHATGGTVERHPSTKAPLGSTE